MYIRKLKLKNYKLFKNLELEFNNTRNVLVGENGSGKTSIIEVIGFVLGANTREIENKGLEAFFNVEIVQEYLHGDRKYGDLPEIEVEVFFANSTEYRIEGIHNSERNSNLAGLRMSIRPNNDYSEEIKEVLQNSATFPFDYYSVYFNTFDGSSYTSYNRYLRYALIDSTKISTNYAMQKIIEEYYKKTKVKEERVRLQHLFREQSNVFSTKNLSIDGQADPYRLTINSHKGKALEENLTIQKDNIDISNFGRGDNMFMNIELALSRTNENTSIVLIEEPENHLSFLNMHRLIDKLDNTTEDKQVFIATHSNMIATRLNLINAHFLCEGKSTSLNQLEEDTSFFFQKSPNNNALNFILAKKIILVEGNAEYILLDALYKSSIGKELYNNEIAMISANGLSFKRYLEIALQLDKKVAIITDNDKNYNKNIVNKYRDYTTDNIKIFAPTDDEIHTFEIAVFKDNEEFIKEHLETPNMNNGVLSYMLANKATASFKLLNELESLDNYEQFTIPKYIEEAFQWIS